MALDLSLCLSVSAGERRAQDWTETQERAGLQQRKRGALNESVSDRRCSEETGREERKAQGTLRPPIIAILSSSSLHALLPRPSASAHASLQHRRRRCREGDRDRQREKRSPSACVCLHFAGAGIHSRHPIPTPPLRSRVCCPLACWSLYAPLVVCCSFHLRRCP